MGLGFAPRHPCLGLIPRGFRVLLLPNRGLEKGLAYPATPRVCWVREVYHSVPPTTLNRRKLLFAFVRRLRQAAQLVPHRPHTLRLDSFHELGYFQGTKMERNLPFSRVPPGVPRPRTSPRPTLQSAAVRRFAAKCARVPRAALSPLWETEPEKLSPPPISPILLRRGTVGNVENEWR